MRRSFIAVLLVALALCAIPSARAYSSVLSFPTASNVMTFAWNTISPTTDACTALDAGSYITMATSEAKQTQISQAMTANGITTPIPMGGITPQATCTSTLCVWRWIRGLYTYSQPIFFKGVYYTGPASSAIVSPTAKTEAVAGAYTNWDTNYPVSWANLSYWGKRQVVMQPGGAWRNSEVATPFSRIICEHFVYQNSDAANGLIPTFPGGSAIPLVSSSTHIYSYCGNAVKRDSQGRWVLPRCGNPFPWWAGLVIAVAGYVILVAVIIAVWCCCCVTRRNKEEKQRQHVVSTRVDNSNSIPTQSELGLSRGSSFTNGSYSSNVSGSRGSWRERSFSSSSVSRSSSSQSH